jgi:hypothetical protein
VTRPWTLAAAALAMCGSALAAQETKPVPKDSMRVSIPGCSKGYVFTSASRSVDEAASAGVPEGLHFRMNGPKKVLSDIKAHEGSLVEITGLVKRRQFNPQGVNIGGGVRISPGSAPTAGGIPSAPAASQVMIDVEGWRQLLGSCPGR